MAMARWHATNADAYTRIYIYKTIYYYSSLYLYKQSLLPQKKARPSLCSKTNAKPLHLASHNLIIHKM